MADIGDNMPPPVEGHAMNINDLYDEAQQWLDGEPITTPEQAEGVDRLLGMIRQARKAADEQRAIEKKPHDDAAKAVQTAWKPLLDKCDLAASVAKKALTPWLQHVEEENARIAEEARQKALQAQEAALAAQRDAEGTTDLVAAHRAKAATKEADILQKAANKAEKAKAQVHGGERATGLRSTWNVEIHDPVEFGKWAWEARRPEYLAFLTELAERECRLGAPRPGVTVTANRKVA